jgi:hypothetical protein
VDAGKEPVTREPRRARRGVDSPQCRDYQMIPSFPVVWNEGFDAFPTPPDESDDT